MPVNRSTHSRADRRFFAHLDRWSLDRVGAPNVFRDAFDAEEIALKRRRFAHVLRSVEKTIAKPIDRSLDWDAKWGPVIHKMAKSGLYFLFTGDRRTIKWAKEALDEVERCPRPHFTYSTCMGVLDLDLRTSAVTESLAMMRWCFEGELDDATLRRMTDIVIERSLRPGLEAMRKKTYAWMHNKANWRIILPGGFAIGGMAWHDKFPEYRELIEFGLDGLLAAFSTSDASGGWNEGPGYWDYGVGSAVGVAWVIRQFTRGRVDLFKHRFLQRTGDFRLYMHTRPGQLWNWSDCGKQAGSSQALAVLARAQQNTAYQWLLHREGIESIGQVYHLDLSLPHDKPPTDLPSVKHFPCTGVVVSRTGFGERDTFVGIKAGDIPHYNHHCQMDAGGLVIHAHGRELLAENEHWQYPREAPKDPNAPRPKRPGLYDEQMKRWKRWDLDSVSAIGHNIPVIEGVYPQPRLHVPPRINVLASDDRHDVIAIDSSAYYKPVASRVRRTVVFLKPDVVLVVDDIAAPRPVRARVQYHYLDEMKIDHHDIRITNGPASLLIKTLRPTEDDNLIVGHEQRTTFYETPSAIVDRLNRFAYAENLWRKKRLVFVTAMQTGAKNAKPYGFAVEGDPLNDASFKVIVTRGRRKEPVTFEVMGPRARIRVG